MTTGAETDLGEEEEIPPVANQPVMVLLVDDQLFVGEAIRRALLDEADIEFHYCLNPNDALAVARKVHPTVILQDLVMPGVNGLDLVRQYRRDAVTKSIPIIVLSTKEEPSIKSDAFRAGANDYLVKIPDRIELVARIRYHSQAYLTQIQRDEAYRALRKSQRDLMETNLELQRLTNVDGLTGLGNRRYFNEYIDSEWRHALRLQEPMSLLMIDVDEFKLYNDAYGHLAGDEVLRAVGQTVMRSFHRPKDLAARFGGEEFVVILPHTDAEHLRMLGERVVHAVEGLGLPHRASPRGDRVTISAGGATRVPRADIDFPALIEAADRALYLAKNLGRNRLVVDKT